MSHYLIENIETWNQKQKAFEKRNIGVVDGVIDSRFQNNDHPQSDMNSVNRIDGSSLKALPGLVDLQVHFRVPGGEAKEDIQTGSTAAVAGGFTEVACMPNTNPCLDNTETIQDLIELSEKTSKCRIHVVPAMTKGIRGEQTVDLSIYKPLGIRAITDDGRGVQDDSMMAEIFQKAAQEDLLIMQHCEVESISNGAPFHEGVASEKYAVAGQSAEAEWRMVARDLELLAKHGGRYHVLHLSTAKSLELIRQAKQSGLQATCEVTPHHLFLCDADIKEQATLYKMNPPLRSAQDCEALIEGLVDGTVDLITTDHAPHTKADKDKEISDAAFGIIGLETSFPLVYSRLIKTGILNWERVLDLMCYKPRELFHLEAFDFRDGQSADFTLVDLEKERIVNDDVIFSKSKNTPFMGEALTGYPEFTFFKGEMVFGRTEGILC